MRDKNPNDETGNKNVQAAAKYYIERQEARAHDKTQPIITRNNVAILFGVTVNSLRAALALVKV